MRSTNSQSSSLKRARHRYVINDDLEEDRFLQGLITRAQLSQVYARGIPSVVLFPLKAHSTLAAGKHGHRPKPMDERQLSLPLEHFREPQGSTLGRAEASSASSRAEATPDGDDIGVPGAPASAGVPRESRSDTKCRGRTDDLPF